MWESKCFGKLMITKAYSKMSSQTWIYIHIYIEIRLALLVINIKHFHLFAYGIMVCENTYVCGECCFKFVFLFYRSLFAIIIIVTPESREWETKKRKYFEYIQYKCYWNGWLMLAFIYLFITRFSFCRNSKHVFYIIFDE